MEELDLIEDKDVREKYINRVDVLEKVKNLLLLPDIEMATTQQVADFYEVDIETIKKVILRNRDELEEDGYVVWKSKDFRKYNFLRVQNIHGGFIVNFSNGSSIKSSNKGASLFPRRAILKVGMLLNESDIAQKVKILLVKECPILYANMLNKHRLRFKKYEQRYWDYLSFTFGKENIQRQVVCGCYYIDFVLYDKIAIEIDENGHQFYDKNKENIREKFIKKKGYFLVRYNPQMDKPYMLINNIMNKMILLHNYNNNIKNV